MPTLPFTLPSVYAAANSDPAVTLERDTGGYDVLIGGHGFRRADDPQSPYNRETEQVTATRFDNSLEPGEQTLSPLPWIKSQASFHAGAGQLNLEQGFTAFQYQQEQIEHIRYDTSYGVNPWTPGKVTRLPDTRLFSFAPDSTNVCTTVISGIDYAMVGGVNSLYQLKWAAGADADPTASAIDLTGTSFAGASNCTIQSLCTDGQNYYAYVKLSAAVGTVHGYVISGSMTSAAAPTCLYDVSSSSNGIVAWCKARLIAGIGSSMYELNANATAHTVLPTANYTHPSSSWKWTCFTQGPQSILGAGSVNGQSEILSFTLTASGSTPVLTGGESQAPLPQGESVTAMCTTLGSFLAVGTTKGLRIATFNTSTGAVQLGPLSVTTTSPVLCITTRDRFFYGGFTNQQADGSTGLVCVDYSMVVDPAGRNAYAPDLRPPSTAGVRTGTVTGAATLPGSGRLIFITNQGVHVEGNGAGVDGDAWLRTSRIRYGTTEPKLFKLGRIRGSLDVASIGITSRYPFGNSTNVGTFGFLSDANPGEFRLPSDLVEYMQLEFSLSGSGVELNGYSVKALPAPQPSELITLSLKCFQFEEDRYGAKIPDPETPRQRWKNVRDLAIQGGEVKYVEFTREGPVTQMVRVEQCQFQQSDPPNQSDDFGGVITVRLRSTEGS